ncbi:LamG domain-containing protein, partial [bacterium]|nr:LamG domain-containing protein [bacterium]
MNNNRSITTNGTATLSNLIKISGSGSLSLDGGGYLSTAHTSDLDLSGDFTIDLWVRPTSAPPAGFGYLFITSQATDGLFVTWNQFANQALNIGQVSTRDILQSSNNSVPLDQWTNITIIRDTGLLQIFINGVLDASTAESFDFTSANTNELRIGDGENAGAGAGFIGYIDEFKLIKNVILQPGPTPTPTPTP